MATALFSLDGESTADKKDKWFRSGGELKVEVVEGVGLPNLDGTAGSGTSDPYAKVIRGGVSKRTSTVKNDINPVWKETVSLDYDEHDETWVSFYTLARQQYILNSAKEAARTAYIGAKKGKDPTESKIREKPPTIRIEVWDEDAGELYGDADDMMGAAIIDLKDVYSKPNRKFSYYVPLKSMEELQRESLSQTSRQQQQPTPVADLLRRTGVPDHGLGHVLVVIEQIMPPPPKPPEDGTSAASMRELLQKSGDWKEKMGDDEMRNILEHQWSERYLLWSKFKEDPNQITNIKDPEHKHRHNKKRVGKKASTMGGVSSKSSSLHKSGSGAPLRSVTEKYSLKQMSLSTTPSVGDLSRSTHDSLPTESTLTSTSTTNTFPPIAKLADENRQRVFLSKHSSRRLVFLSVTNIDSEFKKFDPEVLDASIFLFDADRNWVFRPRDALPENHFDAKYIKCGEEFMDVIKKKEKDGLVFWFRPGCDWQKCSQFFESIDIDPADNTKKMQPLKLTPSWWLTLSALRDAKGRQIWDGAEHHSGRHPAEVKPKFTNSISKVVTNFQSGSFDYNAVSELVYQSNLSLQVRTFL
jgi:hypothetical protein